MKDLTITSRRVLTDRGANPGCVHVRDGVIAAVTSIEDAPKASRNIDVGDDVVMAGLVDTHVHVNEPGRADWEGFATATRAAAAGGVTSIFDMPLNSVPATTNVAALDAKKKAAKGHMTVNVGFIGGVVPGNAKDLKPLHKAGVRMFKCFMVPSGVPEFPHVTEKDLREALPILAELGVPLQVHAELEEHMVPHAGDPRKYAAYLATRPDSAETEAISQVIALADEYKAHVHIVHLSSSQSLPMLRAARARGVHVTVETCPHYLVFDAAGIKDGATEFKCAPPIRSATTRMAMWRALFARDIDQIVSDHSPCPPEMKGNGSFVDAWGGIASLQLGLSAVWSEAMTRGASLAHIAEWMSGAPARLAGVADRKGKLAEGYDADLVIWDPLAAVSVDALKMFQRHPMTPYAGRTLKGHVKATYIKGVEVFRDGEILSDKCGAYL